MRTKEAFTQCQKEHSVSIENRELVTLTGITEVLSYDESAVVMQSNLGQLTLDGEGLNIVKLNLDDGEVSVSGKLFAVYYMEQRNSRGLFSRLFK
ncbi:MAG: sporulation protein YabP [Ruminococcaceae bacterium]|nr:sporulation protein YabP [Oscillospiraceae bacterium]